MVRQKLKEFSQEFLGNDSLEGSSILTFFKAGWWGVLAIILCVSGIAGYHYLTGLPRLVMMLIGLTVGALVFFIFRVLWWLLLKVVNRIPPYGLALFLGGLSSLYYMRSQGFRWPDSIFNPAALITIPASICLFGSGALLLNGQFETGWKKTLAILGVIIPLILFGSGLYHLIQPGSDPFKKEIAEWKELNSSFERGISALDGLPGPDTKGEFKVSSFTYGSGTDENRTEYGAGIKFKTESVDATYLLPDWKGKKKKWREKYWGFGIKELPLNGRVYMPEGNGPFPLFLIVHGNHSMIDYSDDGYGYLGKLLASRGIIAVSLDENFVNGHWSGDFRGKEMPTRAYIMLKHLEIWKNWNDDKEHDLYGKVDMNNIVLAGHSRGGEAVSIAAAFNRLPYYPDDARVKFDFNFNIKGIISIAPTDYRYHRQPILKDINYLSLQGSYDSDEISFWGLRPFHRLEFSEGFKGFKAGVYIHKANHGQFNSTWGRSDMGAPMKWLLNLGPMISKEDQMKSASVFISTFCESTLKKDDSYISIFQDPANGSQWLPDNFYLTHFKTTNAKTLIDFEGDIDISTGGEGAKLSGENLALWKEMDQSTRENGSMKNNVVVLGWDYKKKEDVRSHGSYTIELENPVGMDSSTQLLFSLGAGDLKWIPRDTTSNKSKVKKPKKKENEKQVKLDLKVVLFDSTGNTADLVLSAFKHIPPKLKVQYTKSKKLDKDMFGSAWELQLQDYHIPISRFDRRDRSFNPSKIMSIKFVFDQSNKGVIVLDDIGIQN